MTREENLTDPKRLELKEMQEYLPALRTLRKFVQAMHRLFAVDQSEHQAWCRWRALLCSREYQQVPELVKAMEILDEEQFSKMIAFLRGPAKRRTQVRTNNHVERCNRKLRFWEKVRYKWRRSRTLVRFIVLAMDQLWQEKLPKISPKRKRRQNAKRLTQAA